MNEDLEDVLLTGMVLLGIVIATLLALVVKV